MAIDWMAGYSCEWRFFEVDPATWADGKQVDGVTELSVEGTCDGDASLLESAALTVDIPEGGTWPERWVRAAIYATQGGAAERADVCTMLCSSAHGDTQRGVTTLSVDGRSVLWPASRRSVSDVAPGSYVPAGSDGPAWVADVLSRCGPAPVSYGGGGFTLDDHMVVEGMTVLEACWAVLKAGGWRIRIAGDGSIAIIPNDVLNKMPFDHGMLRALHTSGTQDFDLSGVPNRYIAAMPSGETATAVNDLPESPASTVTRGFIVDPDPPIDSSPTRINGETLSAYCARRLAEESLVSMKSGWEREWLPDVRVGDLIHANVAGIEGDLRITHQSLECGRGIVVSEEAEREVALWQAAT